MCDNNIRTTLKSYVQKNNTWFFWYHNIYRLEGIKEFENKDKNKLELALGVADENKIKEDDSFLKKYKKDNGNPISDVLFGFLDSTLDEARLKKANDFAEYALYISDKRSFTYFRRAESKKEMSGEIDYDKHRDHAVHTLYNYLLGWYIFDNLENFRTAFGDIFFTKLQIKPKNSDHEEDFYGANKAYLPKDKDVSQLALVNHFGDVWPVASLLHDVGYILEGSLSSASPKVEHEHVTNGAKVLHDYFNHWAWRGLPVDFRAATAIAKSIKCVVPDFKGSRSLPSLSDRLCDIGHLDHIREKCNKDGSEPLDAKDKSEYALNREAFTLWELFYKKYLNSSADKTDMAKILNEVKEKYRDDVWKGGDTAKISLNHGVCGGLMLLQAATFWYELIWGLKPKERLSPWQRISDAEKAKNKEDFPVSEKIFNEIRHSLTYTDEHKSRIPAHIWLRGWFSYTDWIKDLWATASVAIHDYVSMETWNPDGKDDLKIDLKTDPLAYLQILVDNLQEWDRYTVLGESAFSGKEPLQSYETKLVVIKNKKPKLWLAYPKRNEYEDK